MRNTSPNITFHTFTHNTLEIETPTPMPPPAKLRKFVVAESFRNYQKYMKENNLRYKLDAIYVNNAEALLSVYIQQEQIVELPCAKRRKDYQRIMEFLKTRIRG